MNGFQTDATTIKPIETVYRGRRFRSRLEARWAVFLDAVGIKWEYEAQGYDLGELGWYLPDFYLPELYEFIEVKPKQTWEQLDVYLAGKCDSDWRKSVNLYGHNKSVPDRNLKHDHFADVVWGWAREAVSSCDVFVEWLSSMDCYGSLVELGLARGQRAVLSKPIVVAGFETGFYSRLPQSDGGVNWDYGSPCHNLWFAEKTADYSWICDTPQELIDKCFEAGILKKPPEVYAKCLSLSKQSMKRCWLVHSLDGVDDHVVSITDPSGLIYTNRSLVFLVGETASRRGVQSKELVRLGIKKMLSARFEHGESP